MNTFPHAGIWTRTTELRRFNDSCKLNGGDTRLQQKWVNEEGVEHWIDVPLVWEPKTTSAPAAGASTGVPADKS